MYKNLTLLFRKNNISELYDTINQNYSERAAFVELNKKIWKNVVIDLNENTSLRLTTLVREYPGDKFSSVILGIYNLFNNKDYDSQEYKDSILSFIADIELVIGVVCAPIIR